MTNRPWNTGEIKVLRIYAALGASGIAQLLERSISSVESKARELRVSLVATGDDFDLTLAPDVMLQRISEAPDLNICPLCGTRLATIKATGMCRVCHLDQLIALRETQLAELTRVKRLTKLRQDKRRLRICDGCFRDFYPRPDSKATKCADCGGAE